MSSSSAPDPTGADAWRDLERLIAQTPDVSTNLASALDEPVERYRQHALAAGLQPATGVQLSMRGRIKIGRWLPFKATQLLAPRFGTVWQARVAGLIAGSDRFVAGDGGMDWRILHRIPLVHADGPDVSRSAAERAAGESIWAPAAMWTRDITWTAVSSDEVQATFAVDRHDVSVRHRIDERGGVTASTLQRWGDPDRTGTWGQHPFGVEITGERNFHGVTIPNRGRAGWHFGTSRWSDGVFFEFEITDYDLVTA